MGRPWKEEGLMGLIMRHPTDRDPRTCPKKMAREAANLGTSPQSREPGPRVARCSDKRGPLQAHGELRQAARPRAVLRIRCPRAEAAARMHVGDAL